MDKILIDDQTFRVLLIAIRQSLIIMLGAIEDYLDMPRSIIPQHKRDKKGVFE